ARRHPDPLDRAEPEPRLPQGRDGDTRDRAPRVRAGTEGGVMGTAVAIEHSAASSPSGDGSYAGPPRAAMDKATIHVFEPQPQGNKGAYTTGPEIFTVQFQFNPKELTFSKAAKWPRQQAKAAKKSASPEFSGAEPTKLSMEMFFDATSDHGSSVVDSVEQLL